MRIGITRGHWKPGNFVLIPLQNRKLCYGRVIDFPLMAFYDLQSDEALPIQKLRESPILFKIWVMKYSIGPKYWPVVGYAPLEEYLLIPTRFFRQDPINHKLYFYDSEWKNIPATFEEVSDLERAAAWDTIHVESRLTDYFEGKPNRIVEIMKPKPLY